MLNCDVLIVGSGVVGSSVARELSKYEIEIISVEKNSDVGFSNTSRGSAGWIHSGIGSGVGFFGDLANKLIVPGNRMMDRLCKELEVPFARKAEIFVARSEEAEKVFKDFESQGLKNGVKGIKILKKDELVEIEPYITEKARSGFFSPSSGVVSPWELIYAQVENSKENGAEVLSGTEVRNITRDNNGKLIVETTDGEISTKYVINSAGLWADTVASMVGDNTFEIIPRKSQALITDKISGKLVKNIFFDASQWIKPYTGTCIGPSTEGNIFITGNDAEANSKTDIADSAGAIKNMIKYARDLFPSITSKDIIRYYTGIRALNTLKNDFIIEPSKVLPQLINVQAGSGGMTCCIAIAKYVAEILKKEGLNLVNKSDFNPNRKAIPRPVESSEEEITELIKKDPRYGHIVCRCEHVSEGEIVEAIKRGARTVDGIKFRTRAGMGRCQGGFCSSRILKIISRELNVPVTSINQKEKDSELVLFKTKDLLTIGKKDGHE
ncbi:MAG: FAD-dependent oxidoreductase [Actinomycetota bacterium]|nr:FAD-dependent oxidoreductase [Actinomycetota bacterium]MDD5621889.1 FAD-dependent oxidoreductase [Actinomycetota bacterium]